MSDNKIDVSVEVAPGQDVNAPLEETVFLLTVEATANDLYDVITGAYAADIMAGLEASLSEQAGL